MGRGTGRGWDTGVGRGGGVTGGGGFGTGCGGLGVGGGGFGAGGAAAMVSFTGACTCAGGACFVTKGRSSASAASSSPSPAASARAKFLPSEGWPSHVSAVFITRASRGRHGLRGDADIGDAGFARRIDHAHEMLKGRALFGGDGHLGLVRRATGSENGSELFRSEILAFHLYLAKGHHIHR